ncbi:putative UPF0481 protein At3g02645 [Zingiber officinale]|uniref:Uncharacterized protein n=1 Tax=Zingiber officinale TaxID=94328 RepID=A0A8J5KKX3_ZINOF|nr:putative UPF0481 protein At3g02645 [Zingiber officinale]KAG6483604.1 hypothetical protein ZIOFF_060252 [Zingiber officinale]
MIPFHVNNLDEIQWVDIVRRALEEELQCVDDDHPATISDVPKPLLSSKPEAYVPQMVALGPFHRHRQELHDMERYKIASAKRLQSLLPGANFHHIVNFFIKLELQIRAHYRRYLKFSGETLAWMMAVDVSFLLEFLRIFAVKNGEVLLGRTSSRLSHLVGCDRRTSAYNLLLCDVIMLENQIPLFLLHKVLELQHSSLQIAVEASFPVLIGFLKEVSPFKMLEISPWIDLGRYTHLLELLYHTVAPISEDHFETIEGDEMKSNQESIHFIKLFVKSTLELISNRARTFILAVLKFLVTIPWRTMKSIPAMSIFTHPVEQLLFSQNDHTHPGPARDSNRMPLLEEIRIPSVTELTKAGIRFSATNGDVSTIQFDAKSAVLNLPRISIDINAETVLRNLVAYETSIGSRPLLLSRYVELMNGIIDTAEDARLLSLAGVVSNHLKSDDEVAQLWNSMTRCVRLTRVENLDKVIEEMNRYYNGRWRVKMRKLMKNYVATAWECLALLVVVLFVLIASVQAFCVLFGCHPRYHGRRLL